MSNSSNSTSKIGNLINWNSGGNLSTTSGNKNFLRYGSIVSNEHQATIIIPKRGTLSNLVVKLYSFMDNNDPSPGTCNSRKFVVRKNGYDTDLSVIISDSGVQKSNSITSIDVDKFDAISLVQEVTSDTAKSAIGVASIIYS